MCCVSSYLWCALPFSLCTRSAVIYELIYLWSISDGMLRGSSKRSYRTRSRKRRRYSGRRRTYRSYRRKRSRLSFDQRMTMVAVKNATSSKRQYGWIARDLGSLVPEVLAVKLFQSAVIRFNPTNAFHVSLYFGSCKDTIRPFSSGLVDTGYSGITVGGSYNSVTATPIGFDRLCGSSGSTSMYRVHMPISMSYDIRVAVYPNAAQLPEAKTETGFQRDFPPWEHLCWHRPSRLIGDPVSQDTADINRCQPGARKQYSSSWSCGIHPGDPTSSVAAYVPIPSHGCRWRGVAWAHSVMSRPFTQYLGDSSNWYEYDGAPAYGYTEASPTVDIWSNAFGPNGATAANTAATYNSSYILVDICMSVLFKNPHALSS